MGVIFIHYANQIKNNTIRNSPYDTFKLESGGTSTVFRLTIQSNFYIFTVGTETETGLYASTNLTEAELKFLFPMRVPADVIMSSIGVISLNKELVLEGFQLLNKFNWDVSFCTQPYSKYDDLNEVYVSINYWTTTSFKCSFPGVNATYTWFVLLWKSHSIFYTTKSITANLFRL